MCLVHDQRHMKCMSNLRNPLHIRHHSVISRRRDKHCLGSGIPLQHLPDSLRRNSTVQSHTFFGLRKEIMCCQSSQISRVINCLVAVSCHQYLTASGRTRGHSGQNSRRAAIYQIPCLTRSVKRGSPLLSLQQNPFGVMQIVKPVYLSYVNQIRVFQRPRTKFPFMPRHVKWIVILSSIFI